MEFNQLNTFIKKILILLKKTCPYDKKVLYLY